MAALSVPTTLLQATATRHAGFMRALANPGQAQRTLLRGILHGNRNCGYGQRYRFTAIDDETDFKRRVPLVVYSDLQAAIDSMAAGQANVLVAGSVRCFEATGGSSGGSKLIPYTDDLLNAFQRAVYPWLHDLFQRRPLAGRGSAYWAISPLVDRARRTAGGLPVGMGSDHDYFDPVLREQLQSRAAVPDRVAVLTQVRDWRAATLRYLLADGDLSLISVWSPSFITVLIDFIKRLGADNKLLHAYLCEPNPLAPALRARRYAQVSAALRQDPVDTPTIWPRLDTVSCWGDASAHAGLLALRALFPHAVVQPKGLLATESAISVPFDASHDDAVLAVTSAYFEFLDEEGRSLDVDQITAGHEYQLAITTPGGLYRYRLGDRIEVTGLCQATPRIRFLGRADCTSDLCGEKLSEAFVRRCLEPVVGGGAMLLPHPSDATYCLLVDNGNKDNAALAEEIERNLRANPQYAHARRLGQLGHLRVTHVAKLEQRYIDVAMRRGQRLGDIKPMVFSADRSWYGDLVEPTPR